MIDKTHKTHFGFESVAYEDKEKKVSEVFQSVALQYDLMNDLMSLGFIVSGSASQLSLLLFNLIKPF